jgi:hypothetical protein
MSHAALPFRPTQGLDSLGYKEHLDYDLVESTNPAFGKAIVRVNVFRAHRQVRQGRVYLGCPVNVEHWGSCIMASKFWGQVCEPQLGSVCTPAAFHTSTA